jgi:hypothetical protein
VIPVILVQEVQEVPLVPKVIKVPKEIEDQLDLVVKSKEQN